MSTDNENIKAVCVATSAFVQDGRHLGLVADDLNAYVNAAARIMAAGLITSAINRLNANIEKLIEAAEKER